MFDGGFDVGLLVLGNPIGVAVVTDPFGPFNVSADDVWQSTTVIDQKSVTVEGRVSETSTAATGTRLRLEQLSRVTEREVAALHGMGPKGISILKAALLAGGRGFAERH